MASDGIDPLAEGWRTPGLPGVFGDFMWVDSPDFGDDPADRRIAQTDDVDPAPLARMIAALLRIGPGKVTDHMRQIADDNRDGPIHLVHLLAACEYAARETGGGMPGPDAPTGNQSTRLMTAEVSGDGIPRLMAALREGGLAAATAVAREMKPESRYAVLDSLVDYWAAPIIGLQIDITNDHVKHTR
jgi:hypothetical protein